MDREEVKPLCEWYTKSELGYTLSTWNDIDNIFDGCVIGDLFITRVGNIAYVYLVSDSFIRCYINKCDSHHHNNNSIMMCMELCYNRCYKGYYEYECMDVFPLRESEFDLVGKIKGTTNGSPSPSATLPISL